MDPTILFDTIYKLLFQLTENINAEINGMFVPKGQLYSQCH